MSFFFIRRVHPVPLQRWPLGRGELLVGEDKEAVRRSHHAWPQLHNEHAERGRPCSHGVRRTTSSGGPQKVGLELGLG